MLDWEQELICPHCWKSLDGEYEEEGSRKMVCEYCGGPFILHTRNTIVFATELIGVGVK